MNSPPLLMFDLGGVLVEVSVLADIQSLLSTPMTADEVLAAMLANDAQDAFEKGLLSAEEFGAAFLKTLPLTVDASGFLAHYELGTRSMLPGAVELLTELAQRYRLAALSNSNVLHWTRNEREFGISKLFERAFSSHEVGLRKPDPAFYRHALAELGVAAADVVFFDDLAVNVEVARSLGMRAYQVDGVEAVRSCLREQGLL